jgi:AAA-like domain
MPRSLRVQQDYINTVKLALSRNGYPSQRSLAEDVGFALATVSNFLTGKPVDYKTFEELCLRLALDWREISTFDVVVTAPDVDATPEMTAAMLPGNVFDQDLHQNTAPRYPSGAVPLGSPFYIERSPFESQIYQEIRKPGALVRIKAPRERGKTSLLLRILNFAQDLGYQTVNLNLEQVDAATLTDSNQFLRWLCACVARQLHLKHDLAKYWDEDLGSKISCTAYFQDYLLEKIDTPLILALDEVNNIFEHPQIARDFLPLLRSWYEEAKALPIWQKLRLIVVHSTEIYIPLQLNQSPFNVGLPIQLENFSLQEIQRLAQCYGIDWDDGKKAQQLIAMVGGHPALVHTALYHLSCDEELTLSQLLASAHTASGIYNNHLQRHWATLAEQPALAQALDMVMSATEPIPLAPVLSYKLSSLGLIERSGDNVVPGCELYRRAFKINL